MIELMPELVVFTDLDGTLLDRETYSYGKALPALKYLRQKEVPIVFCSAKTRAEQEVYRQKLGIPDPFIVENGGAIFIPPNYFPFPFDHHKVKGAFLVIELGMPYEEIRQLLDKVRREGNFRFRGYGDMSAEEVAKETSLDIESAKLAKQREYDETLKFDVSGAEVDEALAKIRQSGLNYAHGGQFYDVMGANDKGKATEILIDLFRRKLGRIEVVGIGDSSNDIPMLSVVDIPILVQKPGRVWEEVTIPRLRRVEGVGPEGWARAVRDIGGVY